ncbi:MAG TPA: FG-GAP-like repeat-containing protein [Fimbriiglobus sp.]|nr:FG-GAP-like repeat-containing protein [Fimbriiglobus sp.]
MPPPYVAARAAPARLRAEELESRLAPAVVVRFDYSHDQSGFFADPERRAALDRAAAAITSRLGDDLAAIAPSGTDTWQASFFNPITDSTVTLDNPTIRANEVLVFVAGAPLGSSELGLATTGGYSASGSRAWLDTVRGRGQAGALANPKSDYATWGGMITFDSGAHWNFAERRPAEDQVDFTSVALHELMHVFGFGLGEPAFVRHVVGGAFAGPAVVAAAGAPVPVVGSPPDHWAPGTRVNSPMQPSLTAGQRRTLTAIDIAVLADIGWEVAGRPGPVHTTEPNPTTVSPPVVTPPPVPGGQVAVGTATGVSLYGPAGQPLATLDPFGGASPGGVRTATADVTGDGVPDLIAGTGPGRTTTVNVLDGKTQALLASITPFEPTYSGGVYVAGGDFTGDGRADVVVTPDQDGGPVVAVYDGLYAAAGQVHELTRFFGLADPKFRGGARPAVGDVSGDELPDLVVAAGTGGGPRVAVFDGRSVRGRSDAPTRLTADFFAFEPTMQTGANVAVADLNGDGRGEVIAGAGTGGAPRVTAFDGRALMSGYRAVVADFFASDPTGRGGVRVAALDLNGDARVDVVTGSGQGGLVNVYAAGDLARGGTPAAWLTTVVPGDLPDGVFVG